MIISWHLCHMEFFIKKNYYVKNYINNPQPQLHPPKNYPSERDTKRRGTSRTLSYTVLWPLGSSFYERESLTLRYNPIELRQNPCLPIHQDVSFNRSLPVKDSSCNTGKYERLRTLVLFLSTLVSKHGSIPCEWDVQYQRNPTPVILIV